MVNYIEIADVRAEGLSASTYPDSKVLAAIETWQAFLERACRQWFESRQKTFSVDGTDSDTLHFGVPIIGIDYIKLNASTDELETTLYKVYSGTQLPDDRPNPRIKLIGPDWVRDIFTAPVTTGRLRFRKGRQNQEIKGTFGYIDNGVKATGAIQFVAKADHVDGETFVLDDGSNPAVTFHIDKSGTYTPGGGYDDTNVQVDISGDTTVDEVAATAKTAINGATTLDVTAGAVDSGGLLWLENDTGGVAGNQVITETVTHADFKVYGMSGGGVPKLIQRALLKLVIEKLTSPLYSATGGPTPPSVLGIILSEATDGHKLTYGYPGGQVQSRRPGLSGITQDQEILDIVKLYRAPLGIATPAHWSED